MIEKYISPLQVDSSKKIPYYQTELLTPIPTEDIPFHYVTQGGDRWDTLSYRFYGTTSNWWVLAKANNLVDGSMAVPPGTSIFVPNI